MSLLHVAVAVIEDDHGRVLLSQRPEHVHQGGLWEFPGGKLEPGEQLGQALRREIWEELDLKVHSHRPLIQVIHHYPDKSVLLDVHRVTGYCGEALGREGQPLAWVPPDSLKRYPMPAADRPIVSAIRLPSSYLITGPNPNQLSLFLHRLEGALKRGLRLVQLRATELVEDDFQGLATAVLRLCRQYEAELILNAPLEWVVATGADGIHLNSRRLMSLDCRPLPADKWVAASCHNESELAQARRLNVDFALLSPVQATASHPDAQPLGWHRFQALIAEAPFPVYALGGMTPDLVETAWAHGGQGIAAIRGLW